MNALTRDLEGLTKSAEACADGKDRFRQKLHLMPRQDGSMIPTDCVSSKESTTHFFNIRHLMQRVV